MNIKLKLPEGYLEEEERCGYTISAEMKKVWAVELDLLAELDRVCKKHHLQYLATGGTLLGAVRHQGYIPWDDDIDLMMSRDDYEKLCKIASQDFEHPYFFQTEYTDPGSLRGHAQLRNSDTTGMMSWEAKNTTINQGIFIDIFPLDVVTDDEEKLQEQIKTAIHYREKMLDCFGKEYRYYHKGKTLKRTIGHVAMKLQGKNADYHELYKKYEAECMKYNCEESKYCSLFSFQPDNPKHYKFREDLGDVMEVPFEMLKMPITKEYDRVLTLQYGDWHTFQVGGSIHDGLIFDTEIGYKEYLATHEIED